jgi:catechol 2,3-dioxygenase-like lactoylglutathione lyase family enzyme
MSIDDSKAYSGFAVPDLEAAREFYGETLGVKVSEVARGAPLLQLELNGGERPTLLYEKADHEPANYTILNFPVADVEAAVDELIGKGVEFEQYEGFDQDEKGIARPAEEGQGPTIAWFTDPAGNILAVHEDV